MLKNLNKKQNYFKNKKINKTNKISFNTKKINKISKYAKQKKKRCILFF